MATDRTRSESVLVPHGDLGPTEGVRNTLIASSRETLRRKGHWEPYEAGLDGRARAALMDASMTPGWVPIDLALAHYRACDGMGLSRAQTLEMGDVVGQRVGGTALGSLFRLARSGGVGPWTPLSRIDQFWGRMYRGGSIAVVRRGPKDALIEVRANALAGVGYWRVALEGLLTGLAGLFARTVYCHLAPGERAEAADYQLSWV